MTPTEWVVDKGIPLLVNAVLIPGGLWFVGAIRKLVSSVETSTSKTTELEARVKELETKNSHLELNLRDLSRYLGGAREVPFKGFRKPEEEDV